MKPIDGGQVAAKEEGSLRSPGRPPGLEGLWRERGEMTELDKMLAAKKEHHTEELGLFLEWLQSKGIRLARWGTHEHDTECYDSNGFLLCDLPRSKHLYPINDSTEKLLAEYTGVDLVKVEKEKQALLEEIRRRNTG